MDDIARRLVDMAAYTALSSSTDDGTASSPVVATRTTAAANGKSERTRLALSSSGKNTNGTSGGTFDDVSSTSISAADKLAASAGTTGTPSLNMEPSPEDSAGIISRLTYSWVTPYLKLGASRPMQATDLPALASEDDVPMLASSFRAAWEKHEHSGPDDSIKPLMRALWDQYGRQYMLCGIPFFIGAILQLIQPLMISWLIEYADDATANFGKGVLITSGILTIVLVNMICEQYNFFITVRVSQKVRIALTTLVYDKSLRLCAVRKGNATNLLNVDPNKIGYMAWHLHRIWIMPIQVAVAIILLYQWLGVSALVALAVTLALAPFNYWMLKNFAKTDENIMKQKDKRVKSLTEILQGVLVVKLFSWEDQMAERVHAIRTKEVQHVRKFSLLLALLMWFLLSITAVLSVLTFSTYVLLDHELTAVKIFPSLVVFNVLTWPILVLPDLISRTSEALISLRRLTVFLRRPDVFTQDRRHEGAPSIMIRSATAFQWSLAPPDDEDDEEKEEREQKEKADKDTAVKLSAERNGHSNGNGNGMTTSLLSSVDTDSSSYQSSDAVLQLENKAIDDKRLAQGITADGSFILQDITFQGRAGDLIAIIGRVGAGKSSLLNALLGEMSVQGSKQDGDRSQYIVGSVSYVPQKAWIRNATVRDNIVFGRSFDQKKYDRVIEACALLPDMKVFPAGDSTEIGEKGVNISGGQKQRISLARALYADTDVYLLDDPLSAVDAHVGQHLFQHCIKTALKHKICVLVTHQLQYLPQVDYIYVLEKGKMQQRGSYSELVNSAFDFASLLKKVETAGDEEKKGGKDQEWLKKLDLTRSTSEGGSEDPDELLALKKSTSYASSPNIAGLLDGTEALPMRRASSDDRDAHRRASLKGGVKPQGDSVLADDEPSTPASDAAKKAAGRMVDEEERETGAVKMAVYKNYFFACGSALVLCALAFLSIGLEATNNISKLWLSYWSDKAASNPTAHPASWYLNMYLMITLIGTCVAFCRQFLWAIGTLNAAKAMHNNLLTSILRAPMSFFYATPTGRIINRFSKDQNSVDQYIPDMISDWAICLLGGITTIILMCVLAPWLLLAAVPTAALYWWIQSYYRKTCRELGRLDSISSSPIFAQYSETIEGLDTVRAYAVQRQLAVENEKLLDKNYRAYSLLVASHRWLAVRIEAVGAILTISTCLYASGSHGHVSSGEVGLLLALASSITQTLNWFVRSSTALESQMNNVERIFHYTRTVPEAPLEIAATTPPASWPQHGAIELKNVSMKYRVDLKPVINDVSCTILPREKIGVVGRTGAGKSSLTNILFRLVEPCNGTILIDGIDVSTIGLRTLRQAIAIIPQDPMLFSGTIRSNLDPFNVYADRELYTALDRVHLKKYVNTQPLGLSAPISENGSNLSVGQRQLLCMGRALLRDTKILVVDEATASVDTETDALIQETIRTEFANRTVLTIAHRLNTIMDSDRVMVMDQGRIVELAAPVTLLSRRDGFFSKLVAHTGEQSAEYLLQLAREAHEAKSRASAAAAAMTPKAPLVISSPSNTSF